MRRQGSILERVFQREQPSNEYRERLQQQANEAVAAEERNRLARDLHDSIKQQIFSIRMSAIAAQAHIEENPAKAREALADIQQNATEAQVEMQALLQQLRPSALEHTSFAEAVRTQAQALEYRTGAHVRVEPEKLPGSDRCPPAMQEAIFRIVQEAFANIARHARADQVTCVIVCDDKEIHVVICDDGQGFDLQRARKGMGLANIQERARTLNGTAEIESAPGSGTTIRVHIPLLLPAEIRQWQEQQEQKAQTMAARARAGLQLRSTVALSTLLVLVIDIALFTTNTPENRKVLVLLILGFCLLMMVCGLISTRLAIAQLTIYRGEKDREVCTLRLQEHMGRLGSLRVALFSSWHIVFWVWRLSLHQADWPLEGGLLLGAGLILALVLFEQRRLKQAQDTCYQLLSGQDLKREVAQCQRTLRTRLLLVLSIAISFFVNGSIFFFLPVELWQWLAHTFFFAFFIQCLCIVIDTWRLRPWKKLALAAARE